ncbi:MAG: hypothetical protein AAF743_00885 [Planctomycetota bacterium]
MSEQPDSQSPVEQAAWFIIFTGVVCVVVLGLNLWPMVVTAPADAVTRLANAWEENPLGGPAPVGLRGMTVLMSVFAVAVSGLIIVAVAMVVSGVRLRRNERAALMPAATTTAVLGFSLPALAIVGVFTSVMFPAVGRMVFILAGPVVLLAWQAALLVKARDALPPADEEILVRPATFHVPLQPGELPPPGAGR